MPVSASKWPEDGRQVEILPCTTPAWCYYPFKNHLLLTSWLILMTISAAKFLTAQEHFGIIDFTNNL